jgi:putative PEP-CTERM system histidine kinase
MAALAIIWVHALVALLFGAVALVQRRAPTRLIPPRLLTGALLVTALWALAVAGIGEGDVATWLMACGRDVAWLLVLAALARSAGSGASGWCTLAYAATAGCTTLAVAVSVTEALAGLTAGGAGTALRMLAIAATLVLAHRVLLHGNSRTRGGRHAAVAALALMWSADLVLLLLTWASGAVPQPLVVARGAVMAMAAPMIAVAVHRDGDWKLRVSHTLVMQGVLVAAAALYAFATALATGMLAGVAGDYARVVQTAFVLGTTTALLTIVSTPWLRAWTKVVVAKHLFAHRYDYRAEWMRFTDTLGAPDDAARPLAVRVVKAIADLTDSPAGLLLVVEDGALRPAEAWSWAAGEPADAALVRYLEATRRIIDLDAVRGGDAPRDAAAIPAWLAARGDAWALVPLMHGERLVGAIALARPTVDRALDWEDFDLLGVVGRQAASYLAEDRAHAALAEARRFDEFNRRFAFILHDLKNLVSQTALVARNAERHADNPAFRVDMIETLRETSQRMTTLLSRLSRNAVAPAETRGAVPVRALLDRLAEARRAQHPVVTQGDPVLTVQADAAGLETVLAHLLQNAVEASAPGVPVTLCVEAAGDEVAIHVADRGAGMSAAFVRDDLFAPFVSRKPGGFGLGAYEARQLVAAMRGRLAVDSREGAGTRFTVTLPRAVTPLIEQAA